MPIAAGIGAAGSIIGAGIGAYGANKAAKTQAQAAQQGLNFQQWAYGQNAGNLMPYINMGNRAGGTLAALFGLGGAGGGAGPAGMGASGNAVGGAGKSEGGLGVNPGYSGDTGGGNLSGGGAWDTAGVFDQFTKLPSYQFPFQQGMLALTRQLNASGKNLSGAQIKAAQGFGQGLASQYFMSNFVNPLFSLYGTGKDAAANLAGTSTTAAGNIGNMYGNLGAANASGIVGATNALTGGLQAGANNLALYSMMGRSPSSYGGAYGNMPGQWNPNVAGGVMS